MQYTLTDADSLQIQLALQTADAKATGLGDLLSATLLAELEALVH